MDNSKISWTDASLEPRDRVLDGRMHQEYPDYEGLPLRENKIPQDSQGVLI